MPHLRWELLLSSFYSSDRFDDKKNSSLQGKPRKGATKINQSIEGYQIIFLSNPSCSQEFQKPQAS